MGLYYCVNCDENHDSNELPAVERGGTETLDLICDESSGRPEPICANCEHRGKPHPYHGYACRINDFWIPKGYSGVPEFGCSRFKSKEE